MRRVAGKDPVVLQACLDGKYWSAIGAAKDAGIVQVPTPLDKVKQVWGKATEEERVAIRQWLEQQPAVAVEIVKEMPEHANVSRRNKQQERR